MKKVYDYINTAFEGLPDDALTYAFKKQLTEAVTARADELTHRGLKDDNVISDLIIGEHPDIRAELEALREKKKREKRRAALAKFNVLFAVLYSLTIVVAFLLALFVFRISHAWLIPVIGFCLLTGFFCCSGAAALSKKRSIFHPLSRLLIAVCVMLAAAVAFFLLQFVFKVRFAYLAFIAGALGVLIADAIYATACRRRFAVFFRLLYVPAAAALIYVLLCIPGIMPWHPGWIIIPASLIIDIAAIIVRVYINQRNTDSEQEEE